MVGSCRLVSCDTVEKPGMSDSRTMWDASGVRVGSSEEALRPAMSTKQHACELVKGARVTGGARRRTPSSGRRAFI